MATHTKIEPSNSIQVIERLARLLDVIAAHEDAVSLKILSAETGLHPSTAFRILSSLAEQGFVERTTRGNYQLGVKLMQLGSRVNASVDIRKVALPLMEKLRDQLGETVNLTVREGDEVVYIERALAKRMIRVEQVIGSRAPMHVTAVGKLMLGELGEAACRSYAKRSRLPAYTINTHTKVTSLLQDCVTSAKRGYALDNEEAELGVGCIGALMRDASGHVVAGLSVSAPIERRRDEWTEQVMDTAAQLSLLLGYHPA
ncbi:MAG: IclR family transcriptional regulator [Nitrosomonadales bacterium]|nr:IclR family transcriptional regulator [Nitrosomonadales bacterium]